MPRAENFGYLITADHKVLNEESESRHNHRYAIVVQDLATRWIISYPCKKKIPGDPEEPNEVLGSQRRKQKVICTHSSLKIWQTSKIRNKFDCAKSSAQSERRDIRGAVAISSGQRIVGEFYGMFLLSAKHSRSFFWWEDTIWKAVRNTSEGSVIPFGAMVEYHPSSPKTNLDFISLDQKSRQLWFLGYAFYAGVNLERTQTLKNWRRWTHQKSTLDDSMQRKC